MITKNQKYTDIYIYQNYYFLSLWISINAIVYINYCLEAYLHYVYRRVYMYEGSHQNTIFHVLHIAQTKGSVRYISNTCKCVMQSEKIVTNKIYYNKIMINTTIFVRYLKDEREGEANAYKVIITTPFILNFRSF